MKNFEKSLQQIDIKNKNDDAKDPKKSSSKTRLMKIWSSIDIHDAKKHIVLFIF